MTAQPSLDLEIPVGAPEPLRHTTSFGNNMTQPVHGWFRYSAGFSAEWVQSLLTDTPGARVLDPFAGSGTTLLAAQSQGAESFGIDSQSFICRVAAAKLNWTASPDEFVDRAEALVGRYAPTPHVGVTPPLLTKCYTPEAQAALEGLRVQVEKEPLGDPITSLLWLALVSIIRPTSHVGTAQWQYVLPNKSKRKTLEVLSAYRAQVRVMADDMRTRQLKLADPIPAIFVEGDARQPDVAPRNWATHVICSPPYANNYDYADATRLEQTVLGEVAGWGDLKPMRNRLIRSCSQAMVRYNPDEAFADPVVEPIVDELASVYAELARVRESHGGKKAYHSMIVAYFHDLARVWSSLRNASIEGAQVCFVIGDSAPYGVYVPVERWLGELALSVGFDSWHFEKVRDRNVKWKNRKHDVPLKEGRLWVRG